MTTNPNLSASTRAKLESHHRTLHIRLRIWRQRGRDAQGRFVDYDMPNVPEDMSFLEMLDTLNERLIQQGDEPVAFDHDCREGICGMCSLTLNGVPHGPDKGVTICQTHMRIFHDDQTIVVEPWRAEAFPVLKDLVVDRTAFDAIIQAGGYVSVNTGGAPDANLIPIPKAISDLSMDAAQCIGCGACVAACKNGSAMLFLSAKTSHLGLLPQGRIEQDRRVIKMVEAHDEAGFGACTNTNACEAVCPKEISVTNIARLNRDYALAMLRTGGITETTEKGGG
jgi:succinate dehydrogenase / fumarate reductase iron-sulfur subunit